MDRFNSAGWMFLRTACEARVLALLLFLMPAVGLAQFTYTTNNSALTITGYIGPGGVVTIPETIDGLPVVGIGSYAFDAATSVTGITIPDSITSIGTYAFRSCSGLASVIIGAGVKSIGFGAFIECRNLTSVTLPPGLTDFQTYAFRACSSLASLTIPTNVITIANSVFFDSGLTNIAIPRSVTSIGSGAFHPCPKLSAITVDALNPVYSSVDGILLNKSQRSLLQCPGGKTGTYTVPQSVTNIGESAFSYCGELTSVTLGTNVATIGIQSFFSCPKLTRFTVPDKVTSIGSSTFAYCSGLTNITIGKSVGNIGSRAFASCIRLSEITVDVLNPSFASVAGVLFNKSQTVLLNYPGGKTGSYTIPSGVTGMGSYAFDSSINLTGVVIPNSVTSIPVYGFAFCTNLTSITIPKSVTSLGDRAFVACSGLTGVYFSGNAPGLGSSFVFFNANKATVYYLPGTTGWGPTFGGRPAVLWNPQAQTSDGSFGIRSNRFGFNITGTSGLKIVVEACADLTNPSWTPLQTNTLTSDTLYFSDPNWTNYPTRFYRLRWP